MSVDALKQEFDLVTRYIHFPLHPETPEEGITIKDLFPNRSEADLTRAGDHIRALMAEAGLPFGHRTKTFNSRLAQELGAWADQETDAGETLHRGIFEAYFADNANIGDPQVLLEIVRGIGLPVDRAEAVLANRLFSPAVNADWQRAWENGITGVPTFTSQDLFVVGHQSPEVLARFIRHLQTLDSTQT